MKTPVFNEPTPVPDCNCDICRYRRGQRRVAQMLENALANENRTAEVDTGLGRLLAERARLQTEIPTGIGGTSW